MDRRHMTPLDQFGGLAEQRDGGPAGAFVGHADVTPRDRVAEGLPRRLLSGVESREPFRPVPLAHGIVHLFFGVDFARKTLAFGVTELVARDLGQIYAHPDDHFTPF